jgi:hypothetical protein
MQKLLCFKMVLIDAAVDNMSDYFIIKESEGECIAMHHPRESSLCDQTLSPRSYEGFSAQFFVAEPV